MKLTDEQAIKIAEWLGWELIPFHQTKQGLRLEHFEHSETGGTKFKEDMKPWLLSDSGEAAIMDRLIAEKFLIFFEQNRENPELIDIELERDGTRGPKCIIVELKAATRRKALINAVLEVISGENKATRPGNYG